MSMFSTQVGEVAAGGDRVLERIEADVEQVDAADAVLGHRLGVLGRVAHAEQAAVHHRVQRLHPPVHHLRIAGQRRDVGDRQAGRGDRRARAAGGDQLDAEVVQSARDVDEAGLVEDRDQRPFGRCAVGGGGCGKRARWPRRSPSKRKRGPGERRSSAARAPRWSPTLISPVTQGRWPAITRRGRRCQSAAAPPSTAGSARVSFQRMRPPRSARRRPRMTTALARRGRPSSRLSEGSTLTSPASLRSHQPMSERPRRSTLRWSRARLARHLRRQVEVDGDRGRDRLHAGLGDEAVLAAQLVGALVEEEAALVHQSGGRRPAVVGHVEPDARGALAPDGGDDRRPAHQPGAERAGGEAGQRRSGMTALDHGGGGRLRQPQRRRAGGLRASSRWR